jgi:gas vesicle protein
LVGVFAGPVGFAVGMAAGGVTGAVGGFVHAEVSDEFLEDIAKRMMPNTYAVLAEVSETWTAPIDTRMEALGGQVLREQRGDVIGDILEKRAEERHARLADWKAKRAGRKADSMETDIEVEAMDVLEKLQRTSDKARRRLDGAKQELDEKLKTLEEQASKAKPEVRKHIDGRIAELRQDFAQREKKLYHALDVAQQALS